MSVVRPRLFCRSAYGRDGGEARGRSKQKEGNKGASQEPYIYKPDPSPKVETRSPEPHNPKPSQETFASDMLSQLQVRRAKYIPKQLPFLSAKRVTPKTLASNTSNEAETG